MKSFFRSLLLGLMGCTAISGVGDLQIDDRPTTVAVAGVDSGLPITVDGSVGDGEKPPPPPSCGAGRVCEKKPPPGWTLVVMKTGSGDGGDACPAGMSAAGTWIEPPSAPPPATCTCTCGSVSRQAACTGNFELKIGIGDTCNVMTKNPSTNGSCTSLGATVGAPAYARVTPPAVTQVACPGTSKATLPPAGGSAVHTCAFGPTESEGCAADRVCVQESPDDVKVCVMSTESAPCPEGYPERHVAGKSLKDTRGCTDCACETRDRCDATFSVSSSSSCGIGKQSLIADGVCRQMGGGGNYVAASGTATFQSGPCAVTTQGTATGSVDPVEPRSICCR